MIFVKKQSIMKRYIFFILLLFSANSYAQSNIRTLLVNTWVNEEINLADGSKIYKPEYTNLHLEYKFYPNDSLRIQINGKTMFEKYKLVDSIISYGESRFKIKAISDVKMVLKQLTKEDNLQEIEVVLIPSKFRLMGFSPIAYLAKNGEAVYIARENYLYPYFVSNEASAAEYVFSKFGFPEWKKGRFVARFIITSKGYLTGVRVEESTNMKYDEKLISAIKATRGMWRAAEWEGKPVTTEVMMEFNMDFTSTEQNNPEMKRYRSEDYTVDGNYFFENKQYKLALSSFSQAIEENPFNIEAYYKRAAVYVLTRQPQKACEDYQTLVNLEQVKAKELFDKYCQKK